jgi:predicted amidohydrolase
VSALRIALGEYDVGWEDPAGSLARAEAVVARSAAAGAGLVALPEMCATGFTMDADRWAEPLDGDSARRLGTIAARHGTWVLAGLAARDDAGPFNAAALFSPEGALAGAYRKQRLFAYGGEHDAYAPGRSPFVFDVEGVRVAPFVCYDLRFPELFRAVARDVDAIVLIANWPAARRAHWDALVKARAIENLCYVVAVNRTGTGGKLEYDGGSVAYDPWGELVAASADAGGGVACVDVDPERVRAVRARYPFLDDLEPASLAELSAARA